MESKETYYQTLGIEASATEDDIRKAYRKQALLWHPDKNVQRREVAEARFKLIAEAYEVLSDSEKRKIYDLYGEEGLKNGGPSYDSGQNFPFQFHDPQEIFKAFFGGRDPFSMFGESPFDTGFGQSSFGFPSFGARPFGAGLGSRSIFDDDPFISSNFGSGTSSSFSFSSNSFSGGGQGGRYVRKSTTTQIVNGVRKTVTTTEDANGNVTVVTETSDGGRQVHQQPQALPRSATDRFNIAIQDGGQQQYQQPYRQQPYQQQQQYQQQQYQQQPYQQQPYQQQPYQQQQYQQQQYQQQQYQQQQYQEAQYQEPQQTRHASEDLHDGHKKHFWSRKK